MQQAGETKMLLPKLKQWEGLAFVPISAGLHWLLAHEGGPWRIWTL